MAVYSWLGFELRIDSSDQAIVRTPQRVGIPIGAEFKLVHIDSEVSLGAWGEARCPITGTIMM